MQCTLLFLHTRRDHVAAFVVVFVADLLLLPTVGIEVYCAYAPIFTSPSLVLVVRLHAGWWVSGTWLEDLELVAEFGMDSCACTQRPRLAVYILFRVGLMGK